MQGCSCCSLSVGGRNKDRSGKEKERAEKKRKRREGREKGKQERRRTFQGGAERGGGEGREVGAGVWRAIELVEWGHREGL